jgi:hypothetical protein
MYTHLRTNNIITVGTTDTYDFHKQAHWPVPSRAQRTHTCAPSTSTVDDTSSNVQHTTLHKHIAYTTPSSTIDDMVTILPMAFILATNKHKQARASMGQVQRDSPQFILPKLVGG